MASKKTRKPARRTPAKSYSKKVGRWRCELNGRTVTCAGAKHGYKTAASALSAYKRINSVKSVENFVRRYGKKATCRVVCGATKTSAKRTTSKRTRRNPTNLQQTLRRYGYL